MASMRDFLKQVRDKRQQPGISDMTETLPRSAGSTDPPPKKGESGTTTGIVEIVEAACGHNVDFKHLAADPRRDKRRADLVGRKCGACRAEDARKCKKPSRLDPKRSYPGKLWGRLPDGANFNVTWDAVAGEWVPTPGLTVPNFHGQDLNFKCRGSALFWVLPQMDLKFRQWWEANHPEEAVAERDRFLKEWEAGVRGHKKPNKVNETPTTAVDEKLPGGV